MHRALRQARKFQISIPKTVRDQQQWASGQEFVFIPKGKGVLVIPVPELNGITKGAKTSGYRDRQDRY